MGQTATTPNAEGLMGATAAAPPSELIPGTAPPMPDDWRNYAWPPIIPPAPGTLLATRQLVRTVGNTPQNRQLVLKGIDLDIARGEFVSIVGASGSGKSTLLYLLGGLDRQDHGEIFINNEALGKMTDARITALRNGAIGFVFQFHFLLQEFTALENVQMPMAKLGRLSRRDSLRRAAEILEQVGLGNKLRRRTTDLSGGEQQRVALARALANDPDLLLADEPTGNLDKTNAENVAAIFEEIASRGNRTIIMVTHDPHMAARAGRILEMDDGRLVGDHRREK